MAGAEGLRLTVCSKSPDIKLVVDIKKNPHFAHRRCRWLGRNASRKKAITAGMMHAIIMRNRRLGRLSMRNPKAAESEIQVISRLLMHSFHGNLQTNNTKPNALRGTVPFSSVSSGVNPND